MEGHGGGRPLWEENPGAARMGSSPWCVGTASEVQKAGLAMKIAGVASAGSVGRHNGGGPRVPAYSNGPTVRG